MFRNRQETIAPSESSVKANKKREELAELGKIEEQYKEQINQLEKQLDDLSREKDERAKNILELKDVKDELSLVIKLVDSAKAELESAKNDKGVLDASNENALGVIEKMSEDINNLQLERNSLIDEVKNLRTAKEELDRVENDKDKITSEIGGLSSRLAKKKSEFNRQMTELDVNFALKEEELSGCINELTVEKNKLSVEADGLHKDIDAIKAEMSDLINSSKLEADNIVSAAKNVADSIRLELDGRDGELSIKEKFLNSRAELLRSVKEQLENKLGKTIDIVEF